MLNVYQVGASEIYLDGKLVQTLGKVSSNPEEIETIISWKVVFHLPLEKNKEHLLAIRFVNSQRKYPKYYMNEGLINIQATSLHNILTTDPRLVTPRKEVRNYYNNLYIVMGIVLFMFVLFLCLYIFFKREKINGYFALTSLLYSCFLGIVLLEYKTNVYEFKYDFIISIFNVLYPLAVLYCIYKIFNKRIGYFYWGISVIGILSILSGFLVSSVYIGSIFGVIILFEFLRVSSLSFKSDKIGALIFLLTGVLNLIFWVIYTLHILGYIQLPQLIYYVPFAHVLLPLSIAIYLGYFFGNRSQSLRLNLNRVQKLSKEKESILSEQKDTLEQQVKERTSELNQSLNELKATQSQLIQSEKMASLGELTAGIAHEIQNPLNFVNNFSEVNKELLEELEEEIDNGNYDEVKALAKDVSANEDKIIFHGKRADGIVKGMLQHSRSSTGQKEMTDINSLSDEYLRLAYHGLRAKDKSFNATLNTYFDDAIGKINIVGQDIGRVILNLITNAFYVVKKKKEENPNGYEPTVSVSTEKLGNMVLIKVSDNGNGVPKEVLDKIFQPFFTTKPSGEGTGLGLSLSYDIVKVHGGELTVETKQGEGTTFTISLPMK